MNNVAQWTIRNESLDFRYRMITMEYQCIEVFPMVCQKSIKFIPVPSDLRGLFHQFPVAPLCELETWYAGRSVDQSFDFKPTNSPNKFATIVSSNEISLGRQLPAQTNSTIIIWGRSVGRREGVSYNTRYRTDNIARISLAHRIASIDTKYLLTEPFVSLRGIKYSMKTNMREAFWKNAPRPEPSSCRRSLSHIL